MLSTSIRLVALIVLLHVVSSQVIIGGAGEEKPADDTVRNLLHKIRPKLESRLKQTFTKFEPVSYREQLVNGMNYFIKIKVDDPDRHIHVRAYKSFDGNTIQLNNVQDNKKSSDPVLYMDGLFSD